MLEKMLEVLNQPDIRRSWQRFTKTDKVNVNEAERLASLVSGGGLTLLGVMRRSPQSLLGGGETLIIITTDDHRADEAATILRQAQAKRVESHGV